VRNRSDTTEAPDFRAFGIDERTHRLFTEYTSIRPTPSNGPVFLVLLGISAIGAFFSFQKVFSLSVGLALLLSPLAAFPAAFLLLIFFAYCAQVYFLNLHPGKTSLRPYNEVRRRWLEQNGSKKKRKGKA